MLFIVIDLCSALLKTFKEVKQYVTAIKPWESLLHESDFFYPGFRNSAYLLFKVGFCTIVTTVGWSIMVIGSSNLKQI